MRSFLTKGAGTSYNKTTHPPLLFLFFPRPFRRFGVLTMAVTAASVCLYLYETTLDHDDDNSSGGGWHKTGHHYPDWFPVAEDALLIFFGLELGLRAVLADQDRSFWTSTVRA